MKILVAHNHYGNYALGGESIVFLNETSLLASYGVETKIYERSNNDLLSLPPMDKVNYAVSVGRSQVVYREFKELVKSFRPDIIHVHNYKYVFSTALFEVAKEMNVGLVLSIHNYRLICPGGQLRRGNEICEECLHHNPIRSLWRSKCSSSYRNRLVQYLFFCRTRSTILNNVDAFIVPTEFGRNKMIEGGIPEKKVFVKPYFLYDPLTALNEKRTKEFNTENGRGAMFIGRLSEEKGIEFLIDTWRRIKMPLTVIGDGPLASLVAARAPGNVKFLGALSHEETLKRLKNADFMIFPSLCHEGLGMTLLEACALGVPIVASDLGGRREVVVEGKNGLLFKSGNADSLVKSINYLFDNPETLKKMGLEARLTYEERFKPEENFQRLMQIYQIILDGKR